MHLQKCALSFPALLATSFLLAAPFASLPRLDMFQTLLTLPTYFKKSLVVKDNK